MLPNEAGFVVVLNGAPRSGKSSIVEAIQETFEGPWMNLGVDVYVRHVTPRKYRPGIGLRPGGERPDLEPLLPAMFAALYDSAAAHSRQGLNVVMDVGHHDAYSVPLHILTGCAARLAGLPAYLVGVRCPLETILERRRLSPVGEYVRAAPDDPIPLPVLRWQNAAHDPGIYDLELDTALLSPAECAESIRRLLAVEAPVPTAFERLAASAR